MEKAGSTHRRRLVRRQQAGGWLLVLFGLATLVAVAGAPRDDPEAGPEEGGPVGQVACDDQQSPVWSLAFSPDGAGLASATLSGEVWLKDLRSRRRELIQRGDVSSARSLAYSLGRPALAIGGAGPVVRILDTPSGEDLEPLRSDGAQDARFIALSRDGRHVAAGGFGSVVTVWDWGRRRRLCAVDGYRRGITALAISPDGSRLATGDSAGLLKLIDVPTGEVRASFQAHRYGNGISALAFSPDGTLVATGGYLETVVRLWGAAEGESRGQLPEWPTGVRALAFSPGGALLALARGDGVAVLWGIAESRVLGTVRANDRALEAIAFSADGRALATGGTDGRVRLWDLKRVLDVGTRARGGVAPPAPAGPKGLDR